MCQIHSSWIARCRFPFAVTLAHKNNELLRVDGKRKNERKMGTRERDRDLELQIPVSVPPLLSSNDISKPSTPPFPSSYPVSFHDTSRSKEACCKVIRSWASKFMSGSVILLPIAITFYFTWWFIHFVDGFFSPIYFHFGINIFEFYGLGFLTSITFIFLVGVIMSSWLGTSILQLGEWFIKKMPLVSYIYSASKLIIAALSLEIVISVGMSTPQILSTVDT